MPPSSLPEDGAFSHSKHKMHTLRTVRRLNIKGGMGMRSCSDFRYRLEEAILDEIACAGLFSAIADKAPSPEQRQLIESVAEDDAAHAGIFAAFISDAEMPVCHPIQMPEAKGTFLSLIHNAVSIKLSAFRRYSHFADYAPTQAARYVMLSVMKEELHHVRLLEALTETVQAPEKNTTGS